MTEELAPAGAASGGGNRYRQVLSTPGALGFLVPGILARFPIGMTGLSILFLISSVRHQYGLAGVLSASSAAGYAMAAPQLARVADRVGQRRILLVCAALCAAAGTAFVTCTLHGAPTWMLFVSAVAMGATTPAIGSMVRARWSGLLAGSPVLATAFAIESVADEVIFIGGPIIATYLASGVHPAAGVVCTLALVCGGSVLLALSRRTEPRRSVESPAAGSALFFGPVAVVAGVNTCFGAMWGSIDVATLSFATDQHHRALAGLLLAAYGIGSTVAGIAYGARQWDASVSKTFQVAAAMMALGTAPMLLVHTPLQAGLVLFLAGATSCPAMIAGMLLVQDGVPASRRTEAMAWQSTAMWLGVAIGSSVSGPTADAFGPHAAYTFAMACGGIGFVISWAGRHRFAVKPAMEVA